LTDLPVVVTVVVPVLEVLAQEVLVQVVLVQEVLVLVLIVVEIQIVVLLHTGINVVAVGNELQIRLVQEVFAARKELVVGVVLLPRRVVLT